jgi:hypothetical protein
LVPPKHREAAFAARRVNAHLSAERRQTAHEKEREREREREKSFFKKTEESRSQENNKEGKNRKVPLE